MALEVFLQAACLIHIAKYYQCQSLANTEGNQIIGGRINVGLFLLCVENFDVLGDLLAYLLVLSVRPCQPSCFTLTSFLGCIWRR